MGGGMEGASSALVTVTEAPMTTPPLGSTTVTESVPGFGTWAYAVDDHRASHATNMRAIIRSLPLCRAIRPKPNGPAIAFPIGESGAAHARSCHSALRSCVCWTMKGAKGFGTQRAGSNESAIAAQPKAGNVRGR